MARQIFDPLQTADTFKEKTVELLAQAILSGKIGPGEKLNESRLARDFQISRTPVREALMELQYQGLVVSGDRRGMFVVSLNPEDVDQINSLRVILEAQALRLARHRAAPEAIENLTKMVKRLQGIGGASPYQQVRADLEFHQALWVAGCNKYLEKILDGLTAPLMAHMMIKRTQSQERKPLLHSHEPLLEFVRGNSTKSAEEVMMTHFGLSEQ